jgi:hypothetical protein
MAPAKAAIDCALALAPDDAAYLAHDEHVRSFAR